MKNRDISNGWDVNKYVITVNSRQHIIEIGNSMTVMAV